MPKYKKKGSKKPYDKSQSSTQSNKEKIVIITPESSESLSKVQTGTTQLSSQEAEPTVCSLAMHVNVVRVACCSVSAAACGIVVNVAGFQMGQWLLLENLTVLIGFVNHARLRWLGS